jgi:N-acyl-D-aspartate/D-glutamate deacylase
MQTATGYHYTIKNGWVSFENGEHTGELRGSLVRGAQSAPR